MKIKKFISTLVCLLFFYSTTGWANSPLTISAKLDKPTVTTGDIFTYTITLKHELDVITTTPDFKNSSLTVSEFSSDSLDSNFQKDTAGHAP